MIVSAAATGGSTPIKHQQQQQQQQPQGIRFYKSGSVSPIPPPPQLPSATAASSAIGGLGGASAAEVANNDAEGSSSTAPASRSSSDHDGRGCGSRRPPPDGVDAKLFRIVKRLISNTPSLLLVPAPSSLPGNGGVSKTTRIDNSANDAVDAVTALMLDGHREYRRKDELWMRDNVRLALRHLDESGGGGGGRINCNDDGNDDNSSRKRGRAQIVVTVGGGGTIPPTNTDNNDDDDEDRGSDYHNAHDIAVGGSSRGPSRTKNIADTDIRMEGDGGNDNGGGTLNATLRNRYRDVNNIAPPASTTTKVVNEVEDGTTTTNDATILSETTDENYLLVGAITTPTTTTSTTTPTRRSSAKYTKKKRKSSAATTTATTPLKTSSSSRIMSNDDGGMMIIRPSPRPTERYSNLGGISSLLTQLRELIEYPLSRPELFVHLGIDPPRGVLLRGPPGCGKTHLARAVAGELNVNYYQVSGPELVGGVSGESECRVRSLFDNASYHAPSIIFIDEIDSIAPKRGPGGGGGGGRGGMEQRIVAQLLTSMDSIHPKNTRDGNAVLVLGATNRPDAIDPALRRAGRFDREIVLGAPDEGAREGILRAMTRTVRVADDVDYSLLAKKTPGFVGADIRSLFKEAAVIAINRIFRTDLLLGGRGNGRVGVNDSIVLPVGENERRIMDDNNNNIKNGGDANNDINIDESINNNNDNNNNDNFDVMSMMRNDVQSIIPLTQEQLEPLYVTMSDFLLALPNVQPSSKREGFATVPDVSWSDIGALVNIREELTLSVLEPISHPERFEALGLPLPAGVLLYGPPGCGKTLLAKAIAKESGANFISVKGPELLDKYVGESERAVRVVFERARSSSPCIIFFDELDSLCPKRGSDGGSGGGGVSERVVNQLLTEMDGLDSRRSVFVIAATNRPELIDPAMLRPGRLDKLLYVPLPSSEERYSILCALSKKIKLASDVDLHAIAHNPHANGFSGADCAALLREAGLAVLRDGVLRRTDPTLDNDNKNSNDEIKKDAPLQITAHHFQYAFEHVLPSVSKKDQARYDKLRDRMARARSRGGADSTTATTAISTESGGGDASDVESSACPPCRSSE